MYRSDVLSLAHETPMAGHLGINKTYRKILDHFYWPGMRKDVKQYCRTCQLVGKPNLKPPLAPLKPIPVTTAPLLVMTLMWGMLVLLNNTLTDSTQVN